MRLVVDSRDRPHVVFVDQRVVSDWLQGSNIPTMFGSAPNFTGILAGAPVGDGEVAVLAQLEDAIHVFAPDGSGVVRDRVLSSTGLPRLSGCPDLPSLSEVEMPRTPCTNTSEGAIDAGLASTADGSLWTVYRFERIERDMVQFCTPENGLISCGQELVAERSSAELVVAHLPPDGTSPVTIRWRTPIALNTTGLTVESRGSRLSVAYASFVPGSDRWAIRYVNLDTANL
jgi:hypothetical protein